MTVVAREDFIGGASPTRLQSGLASGATTLTVDSGGLATWTPVVHGRIPVIINQGQTDEEHLYATAVVGDTLTGLLRGEDDTSDQGHDAGATVIHGLFTSHVDQPNEFLSLPTAAGQIPVSTDAGEWGATTDLDGITLTDSVLTDATLANPTLTSPNIGAGEWGDAQHAHTGPSQGGALPGGTPSASAPGDASSTGTAGAYATADHRHSREAFGAAGDVTSSSPGDTVAAGTSPKVAHADHKHQREPYALTATASTPLDPGAAGTSARVAREDHQHAREAAFQPVGDLLGLNHDVQCGTVSYTITGASQVNVTVTFTTPFAHVPVVPDPGLVNVSGVRLHVIITALSASAVTFRVDHVDGTTVTTSGTLCWLAIAASV